MVERRAVVNGSLLTAMAAVMAPAPAAAVEQRASDADVARAIDQLREVLERQTGGCTLGQCPTIATIRQQQKTFLKANRKYPDYIDAGTDAFEAVFDWHVKNRQEVRASRLPDGRYGIQFMFTTIVLREDHVPAYVGWGYDAR